MENLGDCAANVTKFEERLFGKMKGAGVKGKHGKIKEETWKSITDTLNL